MHYCANGRVGVDFLNPVVPPLRYSIKLLTGFSAPAMLYSSAGTLPVSRPGETGSAGLAGQEAPAD